MQNQVWIIKKYNEVTSTNDVAKVIAETDCSNTVILAEHQSLGRGRRGNSWISQKGNLFFSQVFNHKSNISELVFVSSLSLLETIKSFYPSLNISIKWPNDILINDKKTAGILIEKADNDMVIIGIGVNISQSPKIEQVSYPTACIDETGELDKDDFLLKYLSIFDNNYAISMKDFNIIRENWLKNVTRLNQKIKVKCKDKINDGIFKGIDEQGFLLLEHNNKLTKISTGEVFF